MAQKSRLIVNDDFQCCVTRLYHEGYRFGEATERDARDFIQQKGLGCDSCL